MAPNKSPAFQFYPKDFIAGTATMSLQEVGAYMRLLCYAWDTGSVPNDGDERARICVCSKAQERELWKKVGKKFNLENDAYFNERLEEERQKQAEYRRRQSDKGKASAATRRQPEVNHGSTTVDSRLQPEGNSSSSSSSSSSKELKNDVHRGGGLIVSPLQFERLQQSHAYVGSKLRVPNALHSELIAKSGANADAELRNWYQSLDDRLEESGQGTGDVFAWLRPRHQAFAISRGWIEAAPKIEPAKPKHRGIAEIIAEREAAKGRAS
jgi:uncharacterized protein YdaU (DUF1376 family)